MEGILVLAYHITSRHTHARPRAHSLKKFYIWAFHNSWRM